MSGDKKTKPGIEQRSFERLGRWLNTQGEDEKPSALTRMITGNHHEPPERDWVIESEWARIQQTPLRARIINYVIIVTFLMLLVWASIAKIDEVARGEGKVIPSQQLQIVQSFDGGIVEQIMVKEGQRVTSGQTLLKIDPTRFLSELNESESQQQNLAANIARLSALTSDNALTFPDDLAQQAPNLVRQQTDLYESNRQELQELTDGLDAQIAQRQQDLQEARAELRQHESTLKLTQRELEVTRPLLKSGAVSDIDIIRLERQIAESEGNIQRSQAAIARSQASISEARNKQREARLKMLNRWSSELSEARSQLASLTNSMTGIEDKVTQTEVRSPVSGTIQRLLVNTIGGVVQPGSQIVEIIPADDKLIIEAKIAPKDIAFIQPGQTAMIKFSAYDFSIYGGLDATVDHISADTITDEQDNTYYLVRLSTQQTQIAGRYDIIPGMTAQVDIITGEKSITAYLLKPIIRATSQALTER